jgi:IS30 family transposase
MVKKNEEGEDEVGRHILDFEGWCIDADIRQYILSKIRETAKGEKAYGRQSYHRTLASCFEHIYEVNVKDKIKNSDTLEETIKRFKKFHEEYLKKLEPLGYLEDLEKIWEKVGKNKHNND